MATPLPPPLEALEARLGLAGGTLSGVDKARAEAALADAAVLVLAEAPPAVATAWATDAPGVPVLVALKAARREFENPRGIVQETQGEHTVGLSGASGVYLTAAEVAQVRRAATGRPASSIVSIRTPSAYEVA